MKRDCNILKDHLFDLLVIGGGIHGAATARQLAIKGYDVALVEKGDFCQATSFNSLKILHGGLRYLQHADFKRMRESIRARREFMKLAPHLVHPLACLMPTKGIGIKGKVAMKIALLLNDIISFDRNKGLSKEIQLPQGRILNRKETDIIIPELGKDRISGSALWYDALLLNSERMLLLLLHQAVEHGATLSNYVTAEKITDKGEYQEVVVKDLIQNKPFTVKSRKVINCAGPWINQLLDSKPSDASPISLAKAVNIVVDRNIFGEYAVAIEGSNTYQDKDAVINRGKRLFFFVPWQGKTMIGTTYNQCKLSETNLYTEKDDIKNMVTEINTIFPAAKLETEDVVFSHLGLVPSFPSNEKEVEKTPRLVKHSEIIDHQKCDNINGVLSVRGVKYTTALQIAFDLEKILEQQNFHPLTPKAKVNNTKKIKNSSKPQIPVHYFPHIARQYGEQAETIYRILAEAPENTKYLINDPPLTVAEVLFFIREEMALNLSDVILRRSGLGTGGCPSKIILQTIAKAMANELNWTDEQYEKELQQVRHVYKRMNVQLP